MRGVKIRKIERVINQLDCSLHFRVGGYFRPALIASAAALLTGVGVSYRTQWCQVQAVAVILLVALALFARESERRTRVEYGIKQQNIVYCLNCRRTTNTALSFGTNVALARTESTAYEKLFMPVFSASLLLLGVAAWIAYGALFHEGAHEAAENKAIEVLFGFSDTIPGIIRSARVAILFLASILSLFLTSRFAIVHAVITFLAALLPPASGTPQALALTELIARIALYCTLFVVAETYELNARYCAWLRNAPVERNTLLLAVYCALKGDRGTKPLVDTASTTIDVFSEVEIGRDYSMYRSASRITTVLRSGWVLLVSCEGSALGVLQLLVMLLLLARERKILSRQIADNKVRFVHFEGEPHQTIRASKRCFPTTMTTAMAPGSSGHQPPKQLTLLETTTTMTHGSPSDANKSTSRRQQDSQLPSIRFESPSLAVAAATATTLPRDASPLIALHPNQQQQQQQSPSLLPQPPPPSSAMSSTGARRTSLSSAPNSALPAQRSKSAVALASATLLQPLSRTGLVARRASSSAANSASVAASPQQQHYQHHHPPQPPARVSSQDVNALVRLYRQPPP